MSRPLARRFLMEHHFSQIVLLLGLAVFAILVFQRLRIPSSLAYLAVGILVGPHTSGPVLDTRQVQAFAEFGIVFLLFTIGLTFTLSEIASLGEQVLKLGAGQVILTTIVVGIGAWLAGVPAAGAFVLGAVFAQTSTTILTRQLTEQAEENSRPARLATAMSVFQDVTAVPFVVIIPVLGMAAGAGALAVTLGWALGKALLAFGLVYAAGRWLLRPLFHLVAEGRSAEVFTLTVLFVSLIAGWTTHLLGLSMSFGGFLVGMMLGETEFRHQVETTIRPFRDVLLGLFFVGIGMLFDPASLRETWLWAGIGATVLMASKAVIVAQLVRLYGMDSHSAWRTGMMLAVGGEFGFALLAIALNSGVVDERLGQTAISSVLISMVAAPFLIRFNSVLADRLAGLPGVPSVADAQPPQAASAPVRKGHVIICGYGRIGQSVGHFLEEEGFPFVALDLDPARVRDAYTAGEPVFFGDATQGDILDAVGLAEARLLVVSHEDIAASLKVLRHVRAVRPDLPVMVRTRDESHVEELQAAGASEVIPETLEAGLMIASQALLLLDVPLAKIVRRMQRQRSSRYLTLREFFRGDELLSTAEQREQDRLRPVVVSDNSPAAGRTLGDFAFEHVVATALVRDRVRQLRPAPETRLQAGDVVVLFGSPEDLKQAETELRGRTTV
ncbi:MAG: cation:proton antiporter [Planctomyces sp.]|nr:cation:proton antiporter [Planctomyces sp.]